MDDCGAACGIDASIYLDLLVAAGCDNKQPRAWTGCVSLL